MATEIITKCGNGHDLTEVYLPRDEQTGLYYCPKCMDDDIHEYAVCKMCGKEYRLEDEPSFLDDVCEECVDQSVKYLVKFLEIASEKSKHTFLDFYAIEALVLNSDRAKILATLVKENV